MAALRQLRAAGLPLALVTNTTSRPRSSIASALRSKKPRATARWSDNSHVLHTQSSSRLHGLVLPWCRTYGGVWWPARSLQERAML